MMLHLHTMGMYLNYIAKHGVETVFKLQTKEWEMKVESQIVHAPIKF